MGCFDSIIVECPACGTEVEFQTKAGDCNLDRFTLEEAPLIVLADCVDRRLRCKKCGRTIGLVARALAKVVLYPPGTSERL
jgi:ribosomal protein S27AE